LFVNTSSQLRSSFQAPKKRLARRKALGVMNLVTRTSSIWDGLLSRFRGVFSRKRVQHWFLFEWKKVEPPGNVFPNVFVISEDGLHGNDPEAVALVNTPNKTPVSRFPGRVQNSGGQNAIAWSDERSDTTFYLPAPGCS
jgi:hypothetical protein